MSVTQVQITARDYYVLTKGVPIEAAIALVSVLYYESKLNPGSQGYQTTETPGVLNPHGAYGIASWNGPRQQALLTFATTHSLPVSALDTQLAFVLTEIANSYPNCWAAIRSTASYHAVITVLVDEYENPKNKHAEINGALAFATALAAFPAPVQAASPTAAPQAPTALPHVAGAMPASAQPPMPEAPAGPATILPTSAGRIAAQLDTLVAMRAARIAELIAADQEIAAYDESLAMFTKLGTNVVNTKIYPPPLLQPPSAGPAATTMQGTTMPTFAINWKTTISGIVAAAGMLATQFPTLAPYSQLITAIGTLALGFTAKDSGVTGGTKSAVTGAIVAAPVSLIGK